MDQNRTSQHSLADRFISSLIPAHFSDHQHFFKAKVLCLFSIIVGGLALLILLGLTVSDGHVPVRRLGTVLLASLLIATVIVIRWTSNLQMVGWYVVVCTVTVVWYVDFNNQSILGPITPLWVIPIALSALMFKGPSLALAVLIIAFLFATNLTLLNLGYLPEPVVNPAVWSQLETVQLLAACLVVVVSTRGMTKLAAEHMDDLERELEEKQNRIQQINKLKVEAEASTRSKSIFLATMSHELRTPLNSVIGNAQLLKKQELPETIKTRVSDISSAGHLLLMLINDILDFSKLEANELDFIEAPYSLTDQLIELCRMMEPRVKAGVKFTYDFDRESVVVMADKTRLAQVLMNLLSNAAKFTDQGRITVGMETQNEKDVHIWIEDTGIGIKTQNLSKLFMHFSQVAGDSTRNVQGTGLGLAISKGIVEKMGGSIEVESEYGKGTRFTIRLNDRITHQAPEELVPVLANVEQLNLAETAILIVDDIEMNCVVLEGMLDQFGATKIATVNSGEACLDFLKRYSDTDIVLMDLRMPGMSGDVAAKQARSQGYGGKIVAVTANATVDDRQLCQQAGMDDFLAKPVVMEELQSVLARLV